MRKQIMLKVMATALAAAKAAKEGAEKKIAPRITGVSGSEASSWSPATLEIQGISKYDDAGSAWIDAITEVIAVRKVLP